MGCAWGSLWRRSLARLRCAQEQHLKVAAISTYRLSASYTRGKRHVLYTTHAPPVHGVAVSGCNAPTLFLICAYSAGGWLPRANGVANGAPAKGLEPAPS
eukprot:scaffold1929_cov376-Prasinococcus_capsulatus_cf.AAC.23